MSRHPRAVFLCLQSSVIIVILAATAAQALTLHVSPQGHDEWSGRLAAPNAQKTDGPLASLTAARDAIRQLKQAGPLTEPVTVRIANGAYPLSEPIVFTPEDSGTAAAPITYEGTAPRDVIFYGGRKVTGFEPSPGGHWTANLPEVASGTRYYEQAWAFGYRMVRACEPNPVLHGDAAVPRYFYVRKKLPFVPGPDGKPVDTSRRAFYADTKDIADLALLSPEQLKDANLVAYHAWETSRHRIESVNPRTGAVRLTGNAPWVFQWLGPQQRYHLENYEAALDMPGEWTLSREGLFTVVPKWVDNAEDLVVVVPVVDHFMRIVGDPAAGLPVEHLTFRGLGFLYCGYTLPPEGHGDGQAAVTIPAAVMLDGARNVTFDRCEIGHTGGTYAIWFRRGCRDCAVRHSELWDLGAGGVKIGEAHIAPAEQQTHHCIVDNTIIRGGGRLYNGAVGIWIGQSSDNQITHNDIADLFYSGVSVGWSWGYRDTIAKRNQIEFNHIHHLGWGVMSDMGGVYTLGLSDGTTVSNNVIHDVWSYDKYGWGGLGLYNDEGSTHITMENNLVYHTRDMTYNQHYGKENLVRNNILYCGRDYQLQVSRIEPHLSITFERNLVVFNSGDLFYAKSLGERKLAFDNNLYWDSSGRPLQFMDKTWEQWQALGQDTHSVIADPKFRDPEKLDFTLPASSAAFKIGFRPFDWRLAGLYGDQMWISRGRRWTYPPLQFAPDPPPAPPLVLDEGFESCPVGQAPPEGQVNLEHKGDSIAVSAEAAASGAQSLKFVDVAGLQYSFNPHLVFSPKYDEGRLECSLKLRVEPGAEVWHEYRDWSVNPYLVGPTLNVVGGKLRTGDRVLCEVPVSQWFGIAVSAKLGAKSDGQWQLTVSLPDKGPQQFTLPFDNPKFRKLTWVGFVANATKSAVFYVDDLKLRNVAE